MREPGRNEGGRGGGSGEPAVREKELTVVRPSEAGSGQFGPRGFSHTPRGTFLFGPI